MSLLSEHPKASFLTFPFLKLDTLFQKLWRAGGGGVRQLSEMLLSYVPGQEPRNRVRSPGVPMSLHAGRGQGCTSQGTALGPWGLHVRERTWPATSRLRT